HPAVAVVGYFREEVRAWRGTLQSYFVDHLQESHGVMIEVTNPVPGISTAALPGVGAAIKAGLARFPHAASAGLFVSDTGAGRVIGLGGTREPLLTYRLAPADVRGLFAGIALVTEIFFAAGAEGVYPAVAGVGELHPARAAAVLRDGHFGARALVTARFFAAGADGVSPPVAGVGELAPPREAAVLRDGHFGAAALMPTGFHPMGTARMGRDPGRAVVDSWGAVHGAPAVDDRA